MNDTQKRQALFLGLCIPARLALAFGAYQLEGAWSTILATVLAVIAVGFLVIYAMGWRKTGAETFGQRIWWNDLRPVHGLFYAAASVALFSGNKELSASLIVADTLVGFASFENHHRLLTS